MSVGPDSLAVAAHLLWRRTNGAEGTRLEAAGLDLADARLSGVDLGDAVLVGADLRRADLREARLDGAVLVGADLRQADLSGALLLKADLSRARLSGARLSGADLTRADLSGADLSGADLSSCYLLRTDLSDGDLRHSDLSGADFDRTILEATLWDGAVRAANASGTLALSRARIEVDGTTSVHAAQQVVALLTASGATVRLVSPHEPRPAEPLPWRHRPVTG